MEWLLYSNVGGLNLSGKDSGSNPFERTQVCARARMNTNLDPTTPPITKTLLPLIHLGGSPSSRCQRLWQSPILGRSPTSDVVHKLKQSPDKSRLGWINEQINPSLQSIIHHFHDYLEDAINKTNRSEISNHPRPLYLEYQDNEGPVETGDI